MEQEYLGPRFAGGETGPSKGAGVLGRVERCCGTPAKRDPGQARRRRQRLGPALEPVNSHYFVSFRRACGGQSIFGRGDLGSACVYWVIGFVRLGDRHRVKSPFRRTRLEDAAS